MKNVLVVGGYGEVGRRVAAHLLQDPSRSVTLAGRRLAAAEALAAQLGKRAFPLQLNTNDPTSVREALASRPLVINCVDLQELHLVSESIQQGLTLIDATASYGFWQRVFALSEQAKRRGARVLLGAGLIPGVSNVMAKAAKDELGSLNEVVTGTLLNPFDAHGKAALTYTLSEAGQNYQFPDSAHPERSFVDSRVIDFGGAVGPLKAYRFPFPSQFFYQATLGTTASSWLALEPAWTASLLSATVRLGAQALVKRPWFTALTHRATSRLAGLSGETRFALAVEAYGEGTRRYRLEGQQQSDATAVSLVAMIEQLEPSLPPPGVWLPEQWLMPNRFFEQLNNRDLSVTVY